MGEREREIVGSGRGKMGVCVRDLKSRGWERREGERGRERVGSWRERVRESRGWERGEKVGRERVGDGRE